MQGNVGVLIPNIFINIQIVIPLTQFQENYRFIPHVNYNSSDGAHGG